MTKHLPANILITAQDLIPSGKEGRPLRPISLDIKPGTATCFIGPDGSGKTRYLRALAGIDPQAGGNLKILGNNVSKLRESDWYALRPAIGYASPYTPLISCFNAWRNITMPAQYHHLANDTAIEEKAHNLLTELEVEGDLTLLPAYLTRTQRHKLVLIRTLMLDPQILFLDEPFKPFDPLEEAKLTVFFNKLRQEKNMALVMATHNIRFAIENADSIFYVDRGHLHRFQSGEELTGSTLTDVREFIHSQNKRLPNEKKL